MPIAEMWLGHFSFYMMLANWILKIHATWKGCLYLCLTCIVEGYFTRPGRKLTSLGGGGAQTSVVWVVGVQWAETIETGHAVQVVQEALVRGVGFGHFPVDAGVAVVHQVQGVAREGIRAGELQVGFGDAVQMVLPCLVDIERLGFCHVVH